MLDFDGYTETAKSYISKACLGEEYPPSNMLVATLARMGDNTRIVVAGFYAKNVSNVFILEVSTSLSSVTDKCIKEHFTTRSLSVTDLAHTLEAFHKGVSVGARLLA